MGTEQYSTFLCTCVLEIGNKSTWTQCSRTFCSLSLRASLQPHPALIATAEGRKPVKPFGPHMPYLCLKYKTVRRKRDTTRQPVRDYLFLK